MNIVWFKRDLRLQDNQALSDAIKDNSNILPLYILEPELWQQPDLSHRQYLFLCECLSELSNQLTKIGQSLIIKVGDAYKIIDKITKQHKIKSIYSNQETWNNWTYQRDIRVQKLLKENNITWYETKQNGVIRKLKNRDGWSKLWYQYMDADIIKPPEKLNPIDIKSDQLPTPDNLGLEYDNCYKRQKGGRQRALSILNSFLHERGIDYTKKMSSPVTAFTSCSRLSPYIAFGCISMKEIFHTQRRCQNDIKLQTRGNKTKHSRSIRSFASRLRWHCHFIQKLEDQPSIEFENLHPAYDELRNGSFNEQYFQAWKTGTTGYPMIDACMRALIATGWLNFRMRAMLMSFSSYHLWLDWRKPSLYLATLFTDYEPGIHFSQVQMQSGTTGINSIRIYNPIKQSQDQDPNGEFIRLWIPELKDMPIEYIHTPWLKPEYANSYPTPIVDEAITRKNAAQKIYSVRKNLFYKEESSKILRKHASRKKTNKKPSKKGHRQVKKFDYEKAV